MTINEALFVMRSSAWFPAAGQRFAFDCPQPEYMCYNPK